MQSSSNEASQKKNQRASTVSRVGIVDMQSGEVIDGGRAIYVPPKLRIKGFFMAPMATQIPPSMATSNSPT